MVQGILIGFVIGTLFGMLSAAILAAGGDEE